MTGVCCIFRSFVRSSERAVSSRWMSNQIRIILFAPNTRQMYLLLSTSSLSFYNSIYDRSHTQNRWNGVFFSSFRWAMHHIIGEKKFRAKNEFCQARLNSEHRERLQRWERMTPNWCEMCRLYFISISIDILNQIFRFNNLRCERCVHLHLHGRDGMRTKQPNSRTDMCG